MFSNNKPIKVSAATAQLLATGDVVLKAIAATYITLAKRMDKVPDNYVYNSKTLVWEAPLKEVSK